MAAERRTFSISEAAGLVGVHRNTLAKWINEQGCPAVSKGDAKRGKEWEIHLPDVWKWYGELLRAEADERAAAIAGASGKISRDEADRRTAVAKAIAAEIETEEALRRVVPIADVAEMVAKDYAAIRTRLTSLGAKVAGRAATMTSAPAIQELIDDAVIEAIELLKSDRKLADTSRPGSA